MESFRISADRVRARIEELEKANLEETLDRLTAAKSALALVTATIAELCATAVALGGTGAAASHLACHRRDVETLAAWHEVFGEGYGPASGLDDPAAQVRVNTRWMRAILDTPNPWRLRELALEGEWGAARIRREAGLLPERTAPREVWRGEARPRPPRDGILAFEVGLGDEPPELPERVELVVREEK